MAPVAALAMLGGALAMAPAAAQGLNAADCSAAATPQEEVACLNRALTETQEALARAQRALEESAAREAAAREAEAQARAAAVPAQQELGAAQIARRSGGGLAGGLFGQGSQDRTPGLIVASERVHPNRLQVRLENGQIWRQVQGDTQIVELRHDASVPVEMWGSQTGGYRMRMIGVGRTLRVERIQ